MANRTSPNSARRALAYAKAALLAEEPYSTPIELAEALWALKETDPTGFQEIIRTTKLGRRRAYHLIEVCGRFVKLRLPRERLIEVGWTKLAVVAKYCTPGSERSALVAALKCAAKDLPVFLQGARALWA